jgi:hypothetical protein
MSTCEQEENYICNLISLSETGPFFKDYLEKIPSNRQLLLIRTSVHHDLSLQVLEGRFF